MKCEEIEDKENTNKTPNDIESEGVEVAKQRYRYTMRGVEVWIPPYRRKDGTSVKGHWRLIDANYLRYISPSGAAVVGYKKSRNSKKRW